MHRQLLLTTLTLLALTAQAQISQIFMDSDAYSDNRMTAAQILYSLKEASEMVRKDPQAAIAQFQDTKNGKWNRRSFGLYLLDAKTGELLAYPSTDEDDGLLLKAEEINAKPFAHSSIIKTIDASTKTYVRNIHIEHDPYDLGYGDFYILTLPEHNEPDYVLCAAQNNWQMERLMVHNIVKDAVALIELQGEKAFDSLDKGEWLFDYQKSHIFVIGEDGTLLFDPIYEDSVNRKFTQDQEAFVYGLISGALDHPKGFWTFAVWPSDRASDRIPKWWFAQIASYRGKRYIVGTGVHALHPDAAKQADAKN
ncbi:hypothetical protein [Cerasicoccus fimbriatus]|uniref:hypothetical protein n=1 Tax=Cerasicoccus fimbriatus TaxID=3014554 RepID=UPI0022B44008|nr:hypothetical protein [Cerasicoccus sp. TK19100]